MSSIELSNDEIRRRIFWLLLRQTSLSVWRGRRDAWRIVVQEYDAAAKRWRADDPERIDVDQLPRVFKAMSAFDQGVDALSKGNRSVFWEDQAFYVACHEAALVEQFMYTNPEYWERGIQLAPYPPKIAQLQHLIFQAIDTSRWVAFEPNPAPRNWAILESSDALLDPRSYFNGIYRFPYPVFPNVLPEVPDGEEVIVASNDLIPVNGIWEPVVVSRERILGLLPVGGRQYALEPNGCMNYLLADTRAPMLSRGAGGVAQGKTHWRLLWTDTRYRDGVALDESEYFLAPPPDADSVATVNDIANVRTGDVCPESGLWEPVDREAAPQQVEKGQAMPALLIPAPGHGELRAYHVIWRRCLSRTS